MEKLPHLFKRAKTGKIIIWEVDVLEAKPHCFIDSHSGQFPGNLTTTSKTVKDGKQKRTILEQAAFEAKSMWMKKRDEGYKSLAELDIDARSCTNEELAVKLDKVLPTHNTDANGQVKPMLAKPYVFGKTKLKFPVHVQPKFDGVRCLMIVNSGKVTFLSRNGKPYTLPHIEGDVLSVYGDSEESFVLDGEIYNDNFTFEEILSAVKALKPETLELGFRAYDVALKNTNWLDRKLEFEAIVERLDSNHFEAADTIIAGDEETIQKLHDQWVSVGYEGAMIRRLEGMYGFGQRSSDLLKVKEFDEGEFTIMGGKYMDREIEADFDLSLFTEIDSDRFVFICYSTKAEDTFDVKPVGTRKSRLAMMHNLRGLTGKSLTVKHFGFTDDGLPRFGVGKAIRDYE